MADPELQSLAGQIERVTFYNEENNYTVMAVRVPEHKNLVMAVGAVAGPVAGERVEMSGRFIQHPKFGPRFEIKSCRTAPPANLKDLRKYLGSGLVKGLGPVLADRLVGRFGDRTLDMLDHHPERLTEVEGLGAARREMIAAAWRNNQGLRRLLDFVAQFGLGPGLAGRVFKRLGPEAEALIREDPYRLAYEVDGIGFLTADKAAKALGLAGDAAPRLQAGLLYCLNESAKAGHTYLPQAELMKAAGELLPEAKREDLERALGGLLLAGQVHTEPQAEPGGVDVYTPQLHLAEKWTAKNILTLLGTPARLAVPRPEKALAWAGEKLGLNLSPGQRQAALAAFSHKLVVVTGGPGTGKTTITKVILEVFGALKARLALAAPTGRAAKRLSQATGLAARTVHRLLEYSPQAGGFIRGPKNKLEVDLLLVDEASMLDIQLMSRLTGALPPEAALILVGDHDQLPSVGPGRVLEDLIKSRAVPVARLTDIYRQAHGSRIVEAAHLINQGQMPPDGKNDPDGDFFFIEDRDPESVRAKILRIISQRLPRKFGFDPMEDIQVLTPMHQGPLGAEALNQLLGETLNAGPGASVSRAGRRFKVGDKVMQLRNNYNREVFNGDAGRVAGIDPEAQELTADFDGRAAVYDFSDLDELAPAYAMTVHKSQGSEFPAVIMPVSSAHQIMLRRNLIYTAVTRGRRFVVLIGDSAALRRGISEAREQPRFSKLADRLASGKP